MPGIGDTLREARMRQGLDIADLEARTKIRAKYLRALENEEFSMLPGATFVRTFLRTYAEMLGLDPHLLLDEYRARYEPRDELETASIGPPAASRRERPRRGAPGPPGPGMVAFLVVVAVIGLLLVLGLTGGSDDNSKDSAQTNTTAKKKPAPKKKKPKPAPTSVTLRVKTEFPTYACVDTGQGTDIMYQGTIDGSRTFKGKRLRVNLGKSSVQLTANGKNVAVQQTANPVGFEFTPKGHKDLPVGQRPCA
jgi:cytoskeleton protein RodZ